MAEETGTTDRISVEFVGPEQFDSDKFGKSYRLTDLYQAEGFIYVADRQSV